jgi:hypothetical protein
MKKTPTKKRRQRSDRFELAHPDLVQFLGQLPDREVAHLAGRSITSVFNARLRLNITSCRELNKPKFTPKPKAKAKAKAKAKPKWMKEFLKQEAEWVASNGTGLGIELRAMVAGFQEVSNAPAPWRNGGTRTLSKGTSDEQFEVSASKWRKNRGGF